MKNLWKRIQGKIKGKAAFVLAVMVLAGTLAETPLSQIQAAATNSVIVESTETVTTPNTEGNTEAVTTPDTESSTETITTPDTESSTETVTTPDTENSTETVTTPDTEGSTETVTTPDTENSGSVITRAALGMTRAAAKDWTNDTTGELELSLVDFGLFNGVNESLTCDTKADGKDVIYDASANAYYDVSKMKFSIGIQITKDYDERTIKDGDYFTYQVPAGFKVASGFRDGVLKDNSTEIASYTTGTSADGIDTITVTFTENVNAGKNITGIQAAIALELNFDAAAAQNMNKKVPLMKTEDGTGMTYLQLPDVPSVVDGIEKTGESSQGSTVTWKIKVGTSNSSKGVSVQGLVITDTPGEGQVLLTEEEHTGYGPKLYDANNVEISDGVEITEDGGYKITADAVAPVTLQVMTGMTENMAEASKAADAQTVTFSNKAKITSPEGAPALGENIETEEKEVTVQLKPSAAKAGEMIDSNTIRWTITVNGQTPRTHTYRGVVKDMLPVGLTYVAGSMEYYLNDSETGNTPDPGTHSTGDNEGKWTVSNSLSVLESTGEANNQQTLYFDMAEDTSSKYVVTFLTKVDNNYDATRVENQAIVTAEMPVWGDGPGTVEWDYGTPDCTMPFATAMITKSGEANLSTGLITWTIEPSTRTADYLSAVITDTIVSTEQGSQRYEDNSLKIIKKDSGETLDLADVLTSTDIWNSGTNTLTLSFKKQDEIKDRLELGDLTIQYQTRADSYFTTNYVQQQYGNTATLEVKKEGAEVSVDGVAKTVTMTNKFAKKEMETVYKDGMPLFHFTVTINSNGLDMGNSVNITDSIDDITFKDGSGNELASSYFEFKDETSVKDQDGNAWAGSVDTNYQADSVSCTVYADDSIPHTTSINEPVIVHFYVGLSAAGKTALTDDNGLLNKTITAENSATVSSGKIPGNGKSFTCTCNNSSVKIDNTMVTKKLVSSSGTLKWNVILNPNAAAITDETTFTDEIPKSLKYDETSIKLYEAEYNENGVMTATGEPLDLTGKINISVSLTGADLRIMTITGLKEYMNGSALLLEYETPVVNSAATQISNKASLTVGMESYGEKTVTKDLSAGSWATMTAVGALKLTKQDASVGASMPLSGVKFGVYSDESCSNMVDMGETDSNGTVTFYGLDVPVTAPDTGVKTYYVKEMETPAGYVAMAAAKAVQVKRAAPAKPTTLIIENTRKQVASETIEITKEYYYAKSGEASKNERYLGASEFKIYFYPDGDLTNTKDRRLVTFDQTAEGKYTYNGAGTVSTVKNGQADGKLSFTNLPWGTYEVVETKAPEGFAIPAASVRNWFKIAEDRSVTYNFKNADGVLDSAVISNESTDFTVKKYMKGTTTYVSGVDFIICKKDSTDVMTDTLNRDVSYHWITADSESGSGHKVYNLAAGDYVLYETKDSTNLTIALSEGIPFTVEADGSVTQNGKKVTDNELIVYDSEVQIKMKKADQQEDPVKGAVLKITGPNSSEPDNDNALSVTLTTDDNGEIVFPSATASQAEKPIRGGVYTISETDTPDGYNTLEDVKIRISDDGNSYTILSGAKEDTVAYNAKILTDGTLKLLDKRLYLPIKLQKTDVYDTDTILSGAEFELYKTNGISGDSGMLLLSGITTASETKNGETWTGWDMETADLSAANGGISTDTGKAWSVGLAPNTSYYLIETGAPSGYQKRTERIDFTIDADGILTLSDTAENAQIENGDTIVITDEPDSLQIVKKDKDSGEVLTGAEFTVSDVATAGTELSVDLKEDGSTAAASERANALYGKLAADTVYKLEETKAPDGYARLTKPVYFKLKEDGSAILTDESGTETTYAQVAVSMPDEQTAETGLTFTIDNEKTVLHIEKQDEADDPISGVELTVTGDFADDTSEKTFTTGTTVAELKGVLIEGKTYTLTETEALPGYEALAPEELYFVLEDGKVTITETGQDAVAYNPSAGNAYEEPTIILTNRRKQNTALRLMKSDATDGSGLAGTVFTLTYTPEGGTAPDDSVSAEYETYSAGEKIIYETVGETHIENMAEGELFIPDLKAGTYTLTEKTPVYGYKVETEPFQVQFTVDDRAEDKIIDINKTNVENNAYDLTAVHGESLLTGKGMENERISGTVILQKADYDDGTPLNDVGFAVYRYKEADNIFELLQNLFTGKAYKVTDADWDVSADADGQLTITGLEWGDYYIVETAPLAGYSIDETKYDFSIGKDRTTQVLNWTPGTLINAKVQLLVQQIDSKDQTTSLYSHRMRMSGRFAVSGIAYLEWNVTDEDYVVAGMLLPGETYTLEETDIYAGHTSATKFVFRYNDYGNVTAVSEDDTVEIVMENGAIRVVQKLKPVQIRIRKTDEAGNLLPGAKLSLYRQETDGSETLIASKTTDDAPWELSGAEEALLTVGSTCIIRETEAPEGYVLADDVEFVIADTTDWQEFTMTDELQKAEDNKTEDSKPEDTKTDTDGGDHKNDTNTEKEAEHTVSDQTDSQVSGGENAAGSSTPVGTVTTAAGNGTEETAADTAGLLPKTGRENRAGYLVTGGLLCLLGLCLCAKRKKKQ